MGAGGGKEWRSEEPILLERHALKKAALQVDLPCAPYIEIHMEEGLTAQNLMNCIMGVVHNLRPGKFINQGLVSKFRGLPLGVSTDLNTKPWPLEALRIHCGRGWSGAGEML